MKRPIKDSCLCLMLILTLSLGTGCTKSKAHALENDKIKIGFLMDSLVIERWQKDRDIFTSRAKELGAEVVVKNANEDPQVQIEQVKECIAEEMDVIVIIPYDRTSLGTVLKQAQKNGIQVIAYDRLPLQSDVDLYISFDNRRVGEMMAEHLVALQPQGNYLIINGSPKDQNAYMFKEGYDSVIQPKIDSGEIRLVTEIWAEDWREVYAYNAVDAALESGEAIDAIIGANDDLAEGAIRALLERQMAGSVLIAGHDANLSACQRIVEGTQTVTIYKPIKQLAQKAAELAVALASDEQLNITETISDGEQDIPFVKLTPYKVDSENMVAVIVADGFHQLSEIYRNIPKDQWPAE